MATNLAAPIRNSAQPAWLRARYALFAAIAIMYVYVLWHNESFLINRADPEWAHIGPFKWLLLPHGLAAGCALFLGPFQFSERLRRRFTKTHRVMGRFYVAGVLVGAPMGLYVAYFEATRMFPGVEGWQSLVVASVFQAGLWMACTLMAMKFILERKVQLHRQWMTRSFSCALIFVEVRVIAGLFHWEQYIPLIVWGCVAMGVPLADFVLQIEEVARGRAGAARKIAVIAAGD